MANFKTNEIVIGGEYANHKGHKVTVKAVGKKFKSGNTGRQSRFWTCKEEWQDTSGANCEQLVDLFLQDFNSTWAAQDAVNKVQAENIAKNKALEAKRERQVALLTQLTEDLLASATGDGEMPLTTKLFVRRVYDGSYTVNFTVHGPAMDNFEAKRQSLVLKQLHAILEANAS